MGLDALWPAFPTDRVLFEDDDLVAIDKPEGMATHAPDEERTDDAVTRLGLLLRERGGGGDPYLGIHQRLDKETSGVLVFARTKRANPSLAAQFEGRRVRKVYVACVVDRARKLQGGVLRHVLVREGAVTRVARPRERGQEAVTRVAVLERKGDRVRVELRPETGRTHQLRAQLAAIGAPIAGDAAYGGAPAPRVMLHALALALAHPVTGQPLALEAPLPPAFADWLAGGRADPLSDGDALRRALRDAAGRRWRLGRSTETTAFRLANLGGDGVPGLAIDVYGEHLLVHLYSPGAEASRETVLDAAASLGARGVYVMSHPKHASRIVDPRRESFAPAHASRGEDAASPFTVRELAVAYVARLGDGLKTGLFLDQRENRRRVRELSRGARVLNLFAYTCAFSVAAAVGGAARVVSVDVTPGVLDWGRENLRANGLDEARHELVPADALAWLAQAERRGERFDLAILDPPSFATTKTSRFSAESDYEDLAARTMRVLAPGARLLACTNHRGILRGKFRRQLHQAARAAGRELVQLKDLPDPSDFPPEPGAEPHLKSALASLR